MATDDELEQYRTFEVIVSGIDDVHTADVIQRLIRESVTKVYPIEVRPVYTLGPKDRWRWG